MTTDDWLHLGHTLAENTLGCLDLSDLEWRISLAAIANMRRLLDHVENQVVVAALHTGHTWADVGHILQVTGMNTTGRKPI